MALYQNPLFISLLTCGLGIVASGIGSYFIFVVKTLRRENDTCRKFCDREFDRISKDVKDLEKQLIDMYKEKKGR